MRAHSTCRTQISLQKGINFREMNPEGFSAYLCFYFDFFFRLQESQEFVFTSFSTIICILRFFEICFCDKNLKS
jgi:hypothetical protein